MDEFTTAQLQLIQRVVSGDVRFVYLDPVEGWSEWLAIIIEHPTGVVYGHQCAGTATDQRYVEGFYVPLGGPRFDVDNGALESLDFTAPFHRGSHCTHGWGTPPLPEDRLAKLRTEVEKIPYWRHTNLDAYTREHVKIDTDRVVMICEAWVPVVTPEGKGILVWANCD